MCESEAGRAASPQAQRAAQTTRRELRRDCQTLRRSEEAGAEQSCRSGAQGGANRADLCQETVSIVFLPPVGRRNKNWTPFPNCQSEKVLFFNRIGCGLFGRSTLWLGSGNRASTPVLWRSSHRPTLPSRKISEVYNLKFWTNFCLLKILRTLSALHLQRGRILLL